MRNIIKALGFLLCSSCFVRKGYWIEDTCRPKYANFDLIKTPFKEVDKLTFNKVYTLNEEKKHALGFYNDGRLIVTFNYNKGLQNYDTLSQNFIKKNDWKNARFIGYWRFLNDKIYIEYFVCGNSGYYIREEGYIKGNSVFFKKVHGKAPFFIENVISWEEYVLSDLEFDK